MSSEQPATAWQAVATRLGGTTLLAVLVCLSLPAQILTGNRAEFYSSSLGLGVVLVAFALGLLVVVGLPAHLLPGLLGRAYRAGVAALALAGWVTGSVLMPVGFKSGLLDGKLNLSGDGQAATLELAGLAAGATLGLALALAWRHEARTSRVCLLLALALLVTAGLQTATAPARRALPSGPIAGLTPHDIDPSRLGAVSRSRAALVLLLDGFQSDFLDDILARRPDLAHSLAGFTFYRNTTGIAPTTALSLPVIHSRRTAPAGTPLPQVYAAAVRDGSVLRALARRGWSVSLVNPIFTCPADIETCTDQTAVLRGRWGATVREAAWLVDLALFRSVPLFLKRGIYRDGRWFARSLSDQPETLASGDLIDELGRGLNAVDRPTLHFLHMMGTHPPALVGADCQPEAREWSRASAVDQAQCLLSSVTQFLDRLRAANLYDSATILIMADHGAGFSNHRAPGAQEFDAAASMAGSANPLLLLKRRGAQGPLRYSDAPVALGDVPGTLCALDPGCGGAFGEAVESVAGTLGRERSFQFYNWRASAWEERQGLEFQAYSIRGLVWDTTSWQRVGSPGDVNRRSLAFEPGDGETAYGLGWGPFETSAGSGVRWVMGRAATLYLDLPEGRPLTLQMQAGTVTPKQILSLSVNGRPVGSIPVTGWIGPRRLEIPADLARPGVDELQLTFSEVMAPRPKDIRPLAVVFDHLEVR